MTSRSESDCEPLPKPTLSPFALARPGTSLRVGFFTAAVWCVPALRVPLVHSLINHFRQKVRVYAWVPCVRYLPVGRRGERTASCPCPCRVC
jgi:hypothetical protein